MTKARDMMKLFEASEKLDPKDKEKIGEVFRKWAAEATKLQSTIEGVHKESLDKTDKNFLDEIDRVCNEIRDTFEELTK